MFLGEPDQCCQIGPAAPVLIRLITDDRQNLISVYYNLFFQFQLLKVKCCLCSVCKPFKFNVTFSIRLWFYDCYSKFSLYISYTLVTVLYENWSIFLIRLIGLLSVSPIWQHWTRLKRCWPAPLRWLRLRSQSSPLEPSSGTELPLKTQCCPHQSENKTQLNISWKHVYAFNFLLRKGPLCKLI